MLWNGYNILKHNIWTWSLAINNDWSLHSQKKQLTQLYIFISACFELYLYSWIAGFLWGLLEVQILIHYSNALEWIQWGFSHWLSRGLGSYSEPSPSWATSVNTLSRRPPLNTEVWLPPESHFSSSSFISVVIVQIGNSAKRNMESKKPMVIIHILWYIFDSAVSVWPLNCVSIHHTMSTPSFTFTLSNQLLCNSFNLNFLWIKPSLYFPPVNQVYFLCSIERVCLSPP